MLLRTFVVVGAVLQLVVGQDLSVPGSWRKPNNQHSLDERVDLSRKAINGILGQLDHSNGVFNGVGFWPSANVWSAIANHDHFSNTSTYRNVVIDGINAAWRAQPNFDPNLWWGTAAFYAYRAYGDPGMLSYAIQTWNRVSTHVVRAGCTQNCFGKNFASSATCFGRPMIGAVYWRPTSDDQNINSITTGLFMTLSAYLAELTHDPKYTYAAISSAQWIESININSQGIVLDSVNGHDCSRSPSTWLFSYNSGKYIEGLSVLAQVTGDPHWKQTARNVLASATKLSPWQGADGIITEGASTESNNDGVGFKSIFIRGLNEAFVRNWYTDPQLKQLIHAYVDVQYNALLDLAKFANTYTSAWHGPPDAKFTSWGQMAALDPMVAAIVVNHF